MKLYLVFEPNRMHTDGKRVWAEAYVAVCPEIPLQESIDTLISLTNAQEYDCMAGVGDEKEIWGLWGSFGALQAVEL